MATTIEATFDGHVFRPTEPIALPPNTAVHLIIEPISPQPTSFLQTARSLNLEGPRDWASQLNEYLDGKATAGGD